MDVVNYILSSKVLSLPNKKENRLGLVIPLDYYLSECFMNNIVVEPSTRPVC